jgi:hypothetical protein
MAITVTAAPPGYTRAYAVTSVLVNTRGRLVPASGAQWRPLVPGTDDQYTGPLFGSATDEVPLLFPQRADERGTIEVWSPDPIRLDFAVWLEGYSAVRQVLDLQFTEDVQGEIDLAAHIAAPDDHPLYLTQPEADLLYLPLSYTPPPSGITQADADLRYVNTTGDTMTGALSVGGILEAPGGVYGYAAYHQFGAPAQAGVNVVLEGAAGTARQVQFHTGALLRWVASVSGTEGGSNAGADLTLSRYDDAGNPLGAFLAGNRATGAATFGGDLTVQGGGGVLVTGGHVQTYGNLYTYGGTIAGQTLQLSASAGANRSVVLATGGSSRWLLYANAAVEAGSNAGSDLRLDRHDDAGGLLGAALSITRATGAATFGGSVQALGYLATNDRYYVQDNSGTGVTFDIQSNAAGFQIGEVNVGNRLSIAKTTGAATFGGQVLLPAGTGAAPALAFSIDTGVGLFRSAANTLTVASGGAGRFSFSNTASTFSIPLRGALGAVAAPTYSFSGDTNTGVYSPTADEVAITAGGALQDTIGNATRGFFGTAATTKKTVTGSRGGNAALASLLTALAAYGLIIDSSTA